MKKKPTAKVFIDASNVFYAQKKMGWLIDWKKIKDFFNIKYRVVGINYYVAVEKTSVKTKFLNFLTKQNFRVFTKPLKQILDYVIDENGKIKKVLINKGNFDIEIIRDTLLDKEKYELLILLSGDSDFACLKTSWTSLGRKLIIFSSKKNLAWELRLAAMQVMYFEDIKSKIYRRDWDLTKTDKNSINRALN